MARETNKPIMLFFTAPNCTFSAQMLSGTFCDENIKHLAEQFVCIQVNAGISEELCREFNIKGFPTIQFISPQGIMLKRIAGKQSPEQLAMQMQATIQSLAIRHDTQRK